MKPLDLVIKLKLLNVQVIMKLGIFAEKNASRLIEADINPLIVRPKGKGVIAADALIHYLEDIK